MEDAGGTDTKSNGCSRYCAQDFRWLRMEVSYLYATLIEPQLTQAEIGSPWQKNFPAAVARALSAGA